MKKFLISSSIAALLLPGLALADYNDVSLTASTVLSVGGATLNVHGTTAVVESITVVASSFTVTLQPSSSIEIQSTAHLTLATNAEPAYISTNTCSDTESILKLVSSMGSATITVTPGSACSGTATGSTSNTSTTSTGSGSNGAPVASGGGGGGGSVVRAITPELPVPPPAVSTTPATTVSASGSLTADFGIGAKGVDVEALQSFLEARGFLTMPAGVAKGTYGALTRTAVRAYQQSKGISQTGYVGPMTRASVNAELGAGTSMAAPASASASGSLSADFGIGAKGSDVETLQTLLESKGFLTMPAGVSKGTYGALTRTAVRAYQESKGISQTGYIGPLTRAAVNAELGQ